MDEHTGPELTAEWTVRAQLTISRPDHKRININLDHDATHPDKEPVKIFYNYSTTDDVERNVNSRNDDLNKGDNAYSKTFQFPTSTSQTSNFGQDDRGSEQQQKQQPSNESGFIGSTETNTQSNNNSKCRSTCSIVLSTDFFHPHVVSTPSYNNDRSNYSPTLNVENSFKQNNTAYSPHLIFNSRNLRPEKISFRDASSQTSSNNDKWSRTNSLTRRRGRTYDYRRTTESMLSATPYLQKNASIDEGNNYMPSNYRGLSPVVGHNTSSANSTTDQNEASNTKKQPRTVHIDVYCTGSEDDSHSTTNTSANLDESNSTPQTVFESHDMKLGHVKAGRFDFPRRILSQAAAAQSSDNEKLDLSKTRNELKESKNFLFSKYMGDHQKQMNSVNKFGRQYSDETILTSYPNSSFSTARDVTCSSVSSALASSSQVNDELQESPPVMETDLLFPSEEYLVTYDSFEYDNSERNRIRQLKTNFPGAVSPDTEYYPKRSMSQQREVDLENLSRFPFNLNSQINYPMRRWENTNMGNETDNTQSTVRRPQKHLYSLLEQQNRSSSNSSTMLSNRPGYTREHLLRAKKFGAVVGALRKPGHHVGPAKNPDCMCEHCKRWLVERDEVRGRALSMGDAPLIKSQFWLKKHNI